MRNQNNRNKPSLDSLLKKLKALLPIIKKKYRVKGLEVFGSYVRAEQQKESDLDTLVEFHETIDLFEYIELEEFLSTQLGIKVDLVMKDTLKSRIKNKVLNEAIPV